MFLIFIANRNINEIKETGLFDKKQRRCYNTVLTGLNIAKRTKKEVRFLTLTTSDIQKNNIEYDDFKLNDDHRKLKQRIIRMTPLKMVRQGYIKAKDLRKYYPNTKLNQKLKYDYHKVQTNEGNGVLHNLYKGDFLPYNYLVDNWQDIHNSYNINIKKIRLSKADNSKVASYVVSQYLANQTSTYVRSSQTDNWLFKGYRKIFISFLDRNIRDYTKQYKHYYKDKQGVVRWSYVAPYKEDYNFAEIIKEWEKEVYNIVLTNLYKQTNLNEVFAS